jgi:hypothetical protein
MTRRKAPVSLRAQDVPALHAFCRGYLHEDAIAAYGSAAGAVAAFRADAGPDEVTAAAREWSQFLQKMEGQPLAAIRSTLARSLGASWHPVTRKEIDAVTAAFGARS